MQAGIFFMNTPTQYYRKYIQWQYIHSFLGHDLYQILTMGLN
jgi:hypothetical protein